MQVKALILKHFQREPESWEEFTKLGSMALWIEEMENEKLRALFGESE